MSHGSTQNDGSAGQQGQGQQQQAAQGQQGGGQGQQQGQQGQQGGGGQGQQGQQQGQSQGQQQGQQDPGTTGTQMFTQDQLDAIIADRVSREQRKYEKQLEDERATAGKNETDKLTVERDRAVEERDRVRNESGGRIARSEAKVVAVAEGARSDRVDAVVGNTDLSAAVDDQGEPDSVKIKEAVQKVLSDYPEWKANAQSPPANRSGTDMNGGGGSSEPTLDDFRKMGMAARSELRERNPQLYRQLADKELDARRPAGR